MWTHARAWLPLLIFLAACGGDEEPANPPADPPPDPLVAEIEAVWEGARIPSRFGGTAVDCAAAGPGLRKLLDAHGDRGARALLAYWRGAGDSAFTSGSANEDSLWMPGAAWLADNPFPETDAELLALVADREAHDEIRVLAIVALCRPGHGAALAPLANVALDPAEDPAIARAVLRRIHRVERPLPESLDLLLWLPWHRLDFDAAAAFARTGDGRAPSLLAEGLRHYHGLDDDGLRPLASAALTLGAENARVRDAALALTRLCDRRTWDEGLDERSDAGEALAEALASAIEEELPTTPFDTARQEYLEGDWRRRELAIDGPDAILDASPEDFDFAAAALALTWIDERRRGVALEQIDRLSRRIGAEIADLTEPREILGVLARRLPASGQGKAYLEGTAPWSPSHLPCVLDAGQGNCVGLTSLYLAVGERLDLPLHAVHSPRHVFVRWDDGTRRINVEPTEDGAMYPDEHYRDPSPGLEIREEEIGGGPFLRNLTKREALGIVAANLAEFYRSGIFVGGLDRAGPEGALHASRLAVELFPNGPNVLEIRARCIFEAEPGRGAEALALLDRAEKLHSFSLSGRLSRAEMLADLHRPAEALAEYERALELDPEDSFARRGRAESLIALGRFDEALEAARTLESAELELRARILSGDDGWRAFLESEGGSARADPRLWMEAVESHLQGNAFHAADRETAERLFAELRWIEKSRDPDGSYTVWAEDEDGKTMLIGAGDLYAALKERLSAD